MWKGWDGRATFFLANSFQPFERVGQRVHYKIACQRKSERLGLVMTLTDSHVNINILD